jgi:small-conductance mechanosensitive channel
VKELAENLPWLFIALKIVVILAATWLLAALLRLIMRKVKSRGRLLGKSTNQIGLKLLRNVLLTAVYALGIVTAVKQIPALSTAVTAVLAGSGILAVAVGFAAQESFGNLVSGVFLSIFKPFDVGDRVHLVTQDITGYIEDITLRHTVIRTILGTRLIIPNSVMGSAIVENTNFINGEPTRNFVDVDVSYGSDVDLAKKLMEEVVTSHPLYTGPKPLTVYVRALSASGVSLRATVATRTLDENFLACSDIRLQIKKAFDAHGIVIPFTTLTISNLGELVPNKSDD